MYASSAKTVPSDHDRVIQESIRLVFSIIFNTWLYYFFLEVEFVLSLRLLIMPSTLQSTAVLRQKMALRSRKKQANSTGPVGYPNPAHLLSDRFSISAPRSRRAKPNWPIDAPSRIEIAVRPVSGHRRGIGNLPTAPRKAVRRPRQIGR